MRKRRNGKIISAILVLVLVMQCLCGCVVVFPAGLGDGWGAAENSSFFSNYVSRTDDGTRTVKGRIHLCATDAGVAQVTAEEDSEITVKGKMKNVEGDVQLIFTAPDGTETVIADRDNRKIEKTVALTEGEGELYFTGEGECDFSLEIEAGEGVTFENQGEEPEEKPEKPEAVFEETADLPQEIPDIMEPKGSIEPEEVTGFPGVTDNWPESIVLEDNGMTAQPLYVRFEAEEGMRISVSCTTVDGSLDVKIANDNEEQIYFDEKDPEGSYEAVITETGTCYLIVYARDHWGSVRVMPVNHFQKY